MSYSEVARLKICTINVQNRTVDDFDRFALLYVRSHSIHCASARFFLLYYTSVERSLLHVYRFRWMKYNFSRTGVWSSFCGASIHTFETLKKRCHWSRADKQTIQLFPHHKLHFGIRSLARPRIGCEILANANAKDAQIEFQAWYGLHKETFWDCALPQSVNRSLGHRDCPVQLVYGEWTNEIRFKI